MTKNILDTYIKIKDYVTHKGYSDEIYWQETRSLENLTEPEFLSEGAWVILSSGMKERIIRNVFPKITDAYEKWSSAEAIVQQKNKCEEKALRYFNHLKKIEAISELCEIVYDNGFENILALIRTNGLSYLTRFNYIGPVTSYHFAKNIGFDIVKPDRHLMRIAEVSGFNSPHELCSHISDFTGDKLSVVDLVLWRYATVEPNYLKTFNQ